MRRRRRGVRAIWVSPLSASVVGLASAAARFWRGAATFAIVACARKLLTYANTLVQRRTPWTTDAQRS